MSHLLTHIGLAFTLMCIIAIPTTLYVLHLKGKLKKPAITCKKFNRREKFHKHGQSEFQDDDPQ